MKLCFAIICVFILAVDILMILFSQVRLIESLSSGCWEMEKSQPED